MLIHPISLNVVIEEFASYSFKKRFRRYYEYSINDIYGKDKIYNLNLNSITVEILWEIYSRIM